MKVSKVEMAMNIFHFGGSLRKMSQSRIYLLIYLDEDVDYWALSSALNNCHLLVFFSSSSIQFVLGSRNTAMMRSFFLNSSPNFFWTPSFRTLTLILRFYFYAHVCEALICKKALSVKIIGPLSPKALKCKKFGWPLSIIGLICKNVRH